MDLWVHARVESNCGLYTILYHCIPSSWGIVCYQSIGICLPILLGFPWHGMTILSAAIKRGDFLAPYVWRSPRSQGQPSPQQETHYPPVIKHGWEISGRNEGLMGKSSVYIKGGFSIAMFSYWKVHLANIPSNTDCSCLCTSSPSFNSDTVGDSGCWVCSFSWYKQEPFRYIFDAQKWIRFP